MTNIHDHSYKKLGFTIVEMILVVVILSLLVTIIAVAYRGVRERAKLSLMSTDLRNAADAFELYKFDNGSYPTDMPTNIKTSKNVVLSATQTTDGSFCINAYYTDDTSLKLSWNSTKKATQNSLCAGVAIGAAAGGSVPLATRGVNLMPDFSQWSLTGTATYDSSTGELTLGTNGSAVSPLVRVDQPTSMKTGGDLYATTASPNGFIAKHTAY